MHGLNFNFQVNNVPNKYSHRHEQQNREVNKLKLTFKQGSPKYLRKVCRPNADILCGHPPDLWQFLVLVVTTAVCCAAYGVNSVNCYAPDAFLKFISWQQTETAICYSRRPRHQPNYHTLWCPVICRCRTQSLESASGRHSCD